MSKEMKGKIISYLIENTDTEIEDIEECDNVESLMTESDWKNLVKCN
jgi:hypothetical protein